VFIACGTSFHACLAARQTLEEFASMPVVVELAGDFMVGRPACRRPPVDVRLSASACCVLLARCPAS
jgi:glucosamine--fructose-6-phosphate aminotransferase (isomerizing)